MSRTPLKGLPDFSSISDERLREYIDLAQQMIFAYQYCDEEKTRVMKEVWKQMSDEYSDRLSKAPFIEPEKDPCLIQEGAPVTVHKIKVIKRIKR